MYMHSHDSVARHLGGLCEAFVVLRSSKSCRIVLNGVLTLYLDILWSALVQGNQPCFVSHKFYIGATCIHMTQLLDT